MRYEAEGKLPLDGDTLGAALRSWAARVRALAGAESPPRVALDLAGDPALVGVLAAALPEVRGFRLGRQLAPAVTGAQFLGGARRFRRASCHVDLGAPLGVAACLELVERLADAVPAGDRRVVLRAQASPLRAGDEGELALVLEARGGPGVRRRAAVRLRVEAASEGDPALARAGAAVRAALGVKLGRPRAAPAPTPGAPGHAPSWRLAGVDAWLPVAVAFDEALARAGAELAASALSLDGWPQLQASRSAAFDARMRSVRARIGVGRLSLAPRVKELARARLAGYAFDEAEGDSVVFRRRLSPTLDVLLAFQKLHHWGLGKSFTLELGFELPGTPLAGVAPRRNLFALVHRAVDPPAWAWATREELDAALASCGDLLGRVLPLVEAHLSALLAAPPRTFPDGVPVRGPLSAREALEVASPLLRSWDPHAELHAASPSTRPLWLRDLAPELDGGRLALHAGWGFGVQSRARGEVRWVTVPRVGALGWDDAGLRTPYPALALDGPWLDSPAAVEAVARWAAARAPGEAWKLLYARLGGAGAGPVDWYVGVDLGGRVADLQIDAGEGTIASERWR